MGSQTKVFSGLRWLFMLCFGVAVWCVITVYAPLIGALLFLTGLLIVVSRTNVSRGGQAAGWNFSVFLFALSLLIHGAAVALLTTPIESDFALQYEASQQFARGDYSFQETAYFQRWGYQTGLVIWQGTLLKLWNTPLFLQMVNCVVASATNVLVYRIARDYFEERAARLAGLSYAFFLFPATLVTVLCNNIPSAFFLYVGLYLVMGKCFANKPRPMVYALAGASLAVANALRPDAPLVLVPLLAYFVFRMVAKGGWKQRLATFSKLAVLLVTFLALSQGMSALVQVTGVNAAGLQNHDPLWGTVVGTNTAFGGTYNNQDGPAIQALVEQGLSRSQAEWTLIKGHLDVSPAALLELGAKKMHTLWWDGALEWSMGNLRKNTPVLFALLEELDRAMFTCAFFLAALGAVALFRKPQGELKLYLLPFIFFATSCVYLLLEVQPRYAYVGQIAVFILMAGGVEVLCTVGERLWKKGGASALVKRPVSRKREG